MYKFDSLTATEIIKKVRYLEHQNWLTLSDLTLIPSLKARAFPFGKAVNPIVHVGLAAVYSAIPCQQYSPLEFQHKSAFSPYHYTTSSSPFSLAHNMELYVYYKHNGVNKQKRHSI